MASSTTNLDLILPVGGENVSRQIINANNVKIDEAVGPVPSGTDLQSQVTALNNKLVKYVDTDYMYLNNLTWTTTTSGMNYANIPLPTGVTINGTPIAISIIRTGAIADDYMIQPVIKYDDGTPMIMSNKSTFNSSTRCAFRIIYIPS